MKPQKCRTDSPFKNTGSIYYSSSFPYSTEQDQENQNISTTNGRPRPFYRRTSLTLRQETTEITHQNPKSLVVNVIFDKCLALFFFFLKKYIF